VPVEQALEAAAQRGARVQVRLDGYLWGGTAAMYAANARAFVGLRLAGADVQIVHLRAGDGPGLHMKAAVCDGVAFLDDCNWNGDNDTVLMDADAAQVRAIRRAALQHDVAAVGALSLDKRDALRDEAGMIRRAKRGEAVNVESEALHPSAVTGALREAAKAGARCRVLISEYSFKTNAKTRAEAASLEKAGVFVRAVGSSEKLAVVGARHAWVGSADATSTWLDGDRIEWSVHSASPPIVRGLAAHFRAHWKDSKALA
jgi:hypothetical protein